MTEARKFLQLVEGEHGFLGAVVVENPKAERRGQACLHMTEAHGFLQLLVLEFEVFELGTEHQAGGETGPWRPFGSFANMNLRHRLTPT